MKRFTITILLLIPILTLFGQDHNISIGLNGGIGGNKYFFKENGFDYSYNSRLEGSCGLGLQYEFNSIFINSGIEYATQGYRLEYNYTLMDPGDPNIPRQSELKVSYLRIPVMAGIKLIDVNRIRFNPSLGFDLHFQTKSNEKSIFEDNSERETVFISQSLHKTQVMLEMDLGTEYHISNRFKILVSPYIGKGLSILDFNSMNTGQLSYGCRIGMYIML